MIAGGSDWLTIVRILLLVLGLVVIAMSSASMVRLARGRGGPTDIFNSTVFLFAVAATGSQVSNLGGGIRQDFSAWNILWLSFASAGLFLAILGMLTARKFGRLYAFVPHVDHALAIVDLAAVDPAAASGLADECRRLTAARIVRNG